VSSFVINPATGLLEFCSREDCGGGNPVDLGIDAAGGLAVVANYASGTVGVLSIAPDGKLGACQQLVAMTGPPGGRPADQPSPMPHGVTTDPSGRFFVIPDKGLDRVFVFEFRNGELVSAPHPSVATAAGAGPRHAAFHPTLPMLYVVCELSSTIETFDWDASTAELRPMQSLSTLPPGAETTNSGAEILVSPSGRCVYSSNRGHESIARFLVDRTTGLLRFADWTPTLGEEPRTFAIDPTGAALHVANQNSDSIATFAIDPAGGALSAGRISVKTATPSAICFALSSQT
jgi:6-phosphogluconolactonase (cycloisomerase 2 family)